MPICRAPDAAGRSIRSTLTVDEHDDRAPASRTSSLVIADQLAATGSAPTATADTGADARPARRRGRRLRARLLRVAAVRALARVAA